jgi:hypothetical protein
MIPRDTATSHAVSRAAPSLCLSEHGSKSRTYLEGVQRAIVGFHRDEDGIWVAELACGHQRHVRHQPPFQLRPWVLDDEGRRRRLGTPIDCGLCDQEVPPSAPAAGGKPASED